MATTRFTKAGCRSDDARSEAAGDRAQGAAARPDQLSTASDGYRGPVDDIDISGDWGVPLAEVDPLSDVPEWKLAVVLSVGEPMRVEVGLRPGRARCPAKVEDERVTRHDPARRTT
jgi:membrane carboxypeptidase/penicillin-binding protein